jgi:hypothetical protein
MPASSRFTKSVLGLSILIAFTSSSWAAEENALTTEFAAKYTEILQRLADVNAGSKARALGPRTSGLGSSKLETSSLELGAGLGETTPGLTPLAEWRAMFPIKSKVTR